MILEVSSHKRQDDSLKYIVYLKLIDNVNKE